jgi:hypothetical protein
MTKPMTPDQILEQIRAMPDSNLGSDLKEYLVAMVYDSDWEGYSVSDVEGINKFLADFHLYVQNK